MSDNLRHDQYNVSSEKINKPDTDTVVFVDMLRMIDILHVVI